MDRYRPKRYSKSLMASFDLVWLKRMSLVCLIVQNVSVILVMRYVRVRPGDIFTASTAVVISEVFKLVTCTIIIFFEEGSFWKFLHFVRDNTVGDAMDCVKISVPSIIYVLQNNLLYLAVSHLDAATFQVSYQVKLLTTACFAFFILKQQITKMQWFSLFLLFLGVATVQLQPASYTHRTAQIEQNPLLGLIAVIVACLFSGFAGIYFEKILKSTTKSLWWRNMQLASLGIVFGLVTVMVNDGAKVRTKGFFFGYDWVVMVVILLQSIGGLLVAVVVKYADNILKGFATSAAIVLSAIISMYVFQFHPTWQFIVGAFLVILAVALYNSFGVKKTTDAKVSPASSKSDKESEEKELA